MALKWFNRAVEAGDADGLIEIAKIHLRYGGDRVSGLRFLGLAAAAKGELTEQGRLDLERLSKQQKELSHGDLLYMEVSRLDDLGKHLQALPFLLKGVEAGDSSCQILLGNYLSDGRKGIPVDQDRAVSLYKQAYEQGNSTGASNLAMTYRKLGKLEEAYRWYQLAVEAGDIGSHLALAKIWLHDRGNKEEAIKHLEAIFLGNSNDASVGDRDEAREMLRRLSKAPEEPKRLSAKS
jgi:TPR repeat protein